MKAKLIDGKTISAELRAQMKKEVAALAEDGITPGLAVVIVGDDPASKVYVRNKKKACEELGIYSEEYALPAETTQDELLALIDRPATVYQENAYGQGDARRLRGRWRSDAHGLQ